MALSPSDVRTLDRLLVEAIDALKPLYPEAVRQPFADAQARLRQLNPPGGGLWPKGA